MRTRTLVLIPALVRLAVALIVLIGLFVRGWFLVEPAAGEDSGHPESAMVTHQHVNERLGYSLHYPEVYTVETGENGDIFVVDGVMNHGAPSLEVTVSDVGGGTAEAAADSLANSLAGFDVERYTWVIDGMEAHVVDGVPGQALRRVVFLVHDGRLYQLSFTHAGEQFGDAYARMEQLFVVAVDSFRFIPVAAEAASPPPASSPTPAADVPVIMNRGAPANHRCVAMRREPGGDMPDVHSGPDAQHAVVARLMNWAEIRQSADGWHEIEIPQGGAGWVESRHVGLSVGCEAENEQ